MPSIKSLLFVLTFLTVARHTTASVVTHMDTETLVRLSPVIVHGTVTSVTSVLVGRDALPYTDVVLAARERLREPAGAADAASDTVTLRLIGGSVEGRAAHVYGTPSFHAGEEVVVFARPAKNGWLTVTGLFQGKFPVERTSAGAFAVRGVPRKADRDRVDIVSRRNGGGGGGGNEPSRQPLDAFLGNVRQLALALPAIDAWTGSPGAGSDQVLPADSEEFTFLLIPLRRFEPDDGLPIVYRYNPSGAPAIPGPGGARTAYENALAAWTGATGHAARLLDGGDTAAQCYLTFDGISGISHNDPCGEVPAFDPGTCSGVLAIGGMSELNPFFATTTNGQVFLQGLQGDVVLNSGTECFFATPGSYEEVLTHELGHTLGLGHSCGDANSPDCSTSPELDDAQMRAFAHGDGRGAGLMRDDVKGVRFVYPPGAFVELHANDDAFQPGETFAVDLDLNGTRLADFWLFAILPDGRVTGGLRQTNVPLAYYADLPLIRQVFTGAEPSGRYYLFAILGRPGSGLSAASDVLSWSYVTFELVP